MPNRKRRLKRSSDLYEVLEESKHTSPPKRRYDPDKSEAPKHRYDPDKSEAPKHRYDPDKSEPSVSTDPSCAKQPTVQEKKIEEISPCIIRFSQDTINYKFEDGKKLSESLQELILGIVNVEDIPKITIVAKGETYFTRDNRRLCVFQKYEEHLRKKLLIPMIIGNTEELGKGRITTSLKNCGKSVEIIQEDFRPKDRRKGNCTKLLEKWTCPKSPLR